MAGSRKSSRRPSRASQCRPRLLRDGASDLPFGRRPPGGESAAIGFGRPRRQPIGRGSKPAKGRRPRSRTRRVGRSLSPRDQRDISKTAVKPRASRVETFGDQQISVSSNKHAIITKIPYWLCQEQRNEKSISKITKICVQKFSLRKLLHER